MYQISVLPSPALLQLRFIPETDNPGQRYRREEAERRGPGRPGSFRGGVDDGAISMIIMRGRQAASCKPAGQRNSYPYGPPIHRGTEGEKGLRVARKVS